jgi:pimeloyl-ACP methyl ester carboxylesterase
MSQETNKIATDLRGAAGLTIDAIIGVTNMVESLHYTIAGGSRKRGGSDQIRTNGIPGLVYRNIRSVTQLAGSGIDLLLSQSNSLLGAKLSTPGREAVLSALNGILGDYLVAKNNPLAIVMQFRRDGKPMNVQAVVEEIQNSDGKVVIMVHGSCMNDLQWNRRGHDHGAVLASDLGLVPIYVNYNSGLHTSENGRMLANLLEKLNAYAAQPLELTLIGYSMGGLVSRSACHYGQMAGHTWLKQLRKLVFLGTPHHGALLERGGNWIDAILGISPYSAPFSRLGKIRSSGFTDLRYGNVVDGDWKGRDRFKFSGDERIHVPLPNGVQCYAVAATTAKAADKLGDDLVGDGLVTVSSALGRHKNGELNLLFAENQQWIGREMNHLDLLSHPEVYETIKKWLEED